jgi:Holliday junction DNA helicase RuvA
MLAVFTPDALRRAVLSEDVAALTRVPGIGRKGAQRIVLELAGRLGAPGSGSPGDAAAVAMSRPGGPAPWREQVRTGLVNLGWQARDADHAIAAVEADLADVAAADGAAADGTGADGAGAAAQEPDAAAMLRAALRKLSRA